jgi:hypothetical protein
MYVSEENRAGCQRYVLQRARKHVLNLRKRLEKATELIKKQYEEFWEKIKNMKDKEHHSALPAR